MGRYLPRHRCGIQVAAQRSITCEALEHRGVGGLCGTIPQGGWDHTPRAHACVSGPENANSKLTGLSEQLVGLACKVCQDYLGQLEHEDIDVSEDAAKDLTEDEWRDLTQQYYSLIR